MGELLLADIGSTFTKVCRVDACHGTLLATAAVPTSVPGDVTEGLARACRLAGSSLDADLPLLACSSAAGGLRVAAVGLVPSLTAKAAEMAALGAGAKVVGVFPYLLTDEDLQRLARLRPDLILLSGGTDGGDTKHIVANAHRLATAFADTPLVVAGNRSAYDDLRNVLASMRAPVRFTANVMPELNRLELEPARSCIRELFLERIVVAKGMGKVKERAHLLLPTPDAVLQAVSAMAARAPLLVVDVGGATTDVYSYGAGKPASADIVYRGLPEPEAKRTVEADLGVRHTLPSLMEHVDAELLARTSGLAPAQLREWIAAASEDPSRLPSSPAERAADSALAQAACHLATARHCGRLEEVWTPQGLILTQEGKDLSDAREVIGTGGPAAHDHPPGSVPRAALRRPEDTGLLPRAARILSDRQYVLWAAGLLAAAGHTEMSLSLIANTLREV